jgi:hypothetical protein
MEKRPTYVFGIQQTLRHCPSAIVLSRVLQSFGPVASSQLETGAV